MATVQAGLRRELLRMEGRRKQGQRQAHVPIAPRVAGLGHQRLADTIRNRASGRAVERSKWRRGLEFPCRIRGLRERLKVCEEAGRRGTAREAGLRPGRATGDSERASPETERNGRGPRFGLALACPGPFFRGYQRLWAGGALDSVPATTVQAARYGDTVGLVAAAQCSGQCPECSERWYWVRARPSKKKLGDTASAKSETKQPRDKGQEKRAQGIGPRAKRIGQSEPERT
ncbi:hypothetical protein B0J13DRAFT_525931 [Dactylonectria estremocensis]|uniref:Uncharacterized protein n=1 Tax=Dactylonectria estremocensis TaxID=1079267 RepID=A0A9P9EUH6_9HYPO|nr:hypothetical protein B0J13DRAFT_525931 [Dactylonectria estremocensis]